MSSMGIVHIGFVGIYKAGDQPPDGYLNWHHWAEVQHKAGLRQKKCPRCCLWRYPQEPCHSLGKCPGGME